MIFSFIFQIHNREDTIEKLLIPFIREINHYSFPFEMLIYNDGSTDKTSSIIHSLIQNMANVYHYDTNNLFETEITYDAIIKSKGKYISLIQDDDYYEDLTFANDASIILDKHLEIAALSPKHGVMLNNAMQITEIYGRYNSSGWQNKEPKLNADNFMYVDIIDRAPMIIRKEDYDLIGGVDRNLLVGGYNDWDMCIRWRKIGKRVALYDTKGYMFRHWDAGSLRKNSVITSQHGANRNKTYAKHKEFLATSGNY